MRALGGALFLTVMIGSGSVLANGLEHLNQGAKGAGRGGASTAMADDSQAVARNPALLTQLAGTRVDGTLFLNYERVRKRNATDYVRDESFGLWPLPVLSFSTDLTEEGDVDAPDFRERGPYVGFGLFQPVRGVLAPTLTVALELSETFSFGVSLNVLLTYAKLKITRGGKGGGRSRAADWRPDGDVFLHYQPDGTPIVPPQPFDPGTGEQLTWAEVFDVGFGAVSIGGPGGGGEASDAEAPHVDYELESLFGAGVAGQIGFLWTPSSELSLGLSVRTPGIIFRPRGRARLDLTQAVGALENNPSVGLLIGALVDTTLPDRGANGFASDYDVTLDDIIIPPSVSLGVAWWPLPRWVVSADLRWIGWSAMRDVRIRLSGGTNADLNEIAGGSDAEYEFELAWRDQFVAALGTTFGVNDWLLLRAGYNYGANPIPTRDTPASALATEHRLSVGVGLRCGDWDFDLAYVYGVPKQVDTPGASFKVELHQFVLGVGYAF